MFHNSNMKLQIAKLETNEWKNLKCVTVEIPSAGTNEQKACAFYQIWMFANQSVWFLFVVSKKN